MFRSIVFSKNLIRSTKQPSFHLKSCLLPMQLVSVPTSALEHKRFFRVTAPRENLLIVGGATVLATAVTLQYAHTWYTAYQAQKAAGPDAASATASEDATADATHKSTAEQQASAAGDSNASSSKKSDSSASSDSSSADPAAAGPSFSSSWFAKSFYDGGFEEKMTRREAALILGVRESATPERVKDAHRRILLLNHPDRGGSAFIAAKVHEAKDMLMKGTR